MDINSELKDAQLEILDADNAYSGNRKGLIWFNRTTDKIKAIYNSAVQILATEEYVTDKDATLRQDIETDGMSNFVATQQGSDPAAPASGLRRIFTKSDGVYERGNGESSQKLYNINDFNSSLASTLASSYDAISATFDSGQVSEGNNATVVSSLPQASIAIFEHYDNSGSNVYPFFEIGGVRIYLEDMIAGATKHSVAMIPKGARIGYDSSDFGSGRAAFRVKCYYIL